MSGKHKELTPVLEDSSKYQNVKHVSVDKTVEALVDVIEKEGGVELLAREGEINRVGMVIKLVEETSKATIVSLKTEYSTEKRDNRDVNVTLFRVVFAKK